MNWLQLIFNQFNSVPELTQVLNNIWTLLPVKIQIPSYENVSVIKQIHEAIFKFYSYFSEMDKNLSVPVPTWITSLLNLDPFHMNVVESSTVNTSGSNVNITNVQDNLNPTRGANNNNMINLENTDNTVNSTDTTNTDNTNTINSTDNTNTVNDTNMEEKNMKETKTEDVIMKETKPESMKVKESHIRVFDERQTSKIKEHIMTEEDHRRIILGLPFEPEIIENPAEWSQDIFDSNTDKNVPSERFSSSSPTVVGDIPQTSAVAPDPNELTVTTPDYPNSGEMDYSDDEYYNDYTMKSTALESSDTNKIKPESTNIKDTTIADTKPRVVESFNSDKTWTWPPKNMESSVIHDVESTSLESSSIAKVESVTIENSNLDSVEPGLTDTTIEDQPKSRTIEKGKWPELQMHLIDTPVEKVKAVIMESRPYSTEPGPSNYWVTDSNPSASDLNSDPSKDLESSSNERKRVMDNSDSEPETARKTRTSKRSRFSDIPLAWGLYFQDGASPSFEGIVELHNRIMFYLVLILFGVSWVMLSIMTNFNKKNNPLVYRHLNHGTLIELIWTVGPALVLVAIAFPSFKLLYLMDKYFVLYF